MSPADRELHLAIIRHLKGLIKAYEQWVKAKAAGENPPA